MMRPANPVTLPLADYSPRNFLLAVTDGVVVAVQADGALVIFLPAATCSKSLARWSRWTPRG